jgi:hypothetical protein
LQFTPPPNLKSPHAAIYKATIQSPKRHTKSPPFFFFFLLFFFSLSFTIFLPPSLSFASSAACRGGRKKRRGRGLFSLMGYGLF